MWRATRQGKAYMTTSFCGHPVRIVDFPATRIAALQHCGDPALIGESLWRFITWRRQAGLPPKLSATFNILYGNSNTTAPEDFRLDLCAETTDAVSPNGYGVIAGQIPAGRCAVIRVIGASDNLAPRSPSSVTRKRRRASRFSRLRATSEFVSPRFRK